VGIWTSAIVWLSEQNTLFSEKGHLRFRVGIRETSIQLGHSESAVISQKSRKNFALLITVIRIA
jgi:hypothetical protein